MPPSELKEETKLKLLAHLKEAGKPITTLEWAKRADVNRATVYRYMPLMQQEKWLNEKPGPGRSILYSIKPNRAVLPVDQIKDATKKPTELRYNKKDLAQLLFRNLNVAKEQPVVSRSMFVTPNLLKITAHLYRQASFAISGEVPSKEVLDQCKAKLNELRYVLEEVFKVVNGMLLTPELWEPRLIYGYLSGNFDTIQLAQWVTDAEANADIMIDLLLSAQDGSLWVLFDKDSNEV